MIGAITKEVICKVTKLDNGKFWYSYANIDLFGEISCKESIEIIKQIFEYQTV